MPRPKILAFRHASYESLGTPDSLLKEAGFRSRYVNFGLDPGERASLDRYAALIVLGGPTKSDRIDSYPNLITEVRLLREARDRTLSVRGICLADQLLPRALGGTVSRNPARIRRQTPGFSDALQALSRATFSRWVDRFDLPPRRRMLRSR